MRTAALIVAGGSGSRVGAPLPKQFLPLLGRPLITYTLNTFDQSPSIHDIYLTLPENYLSYFDQQILKNHSYSKLRKILPGGKTRQESTQKGFEAILPKTDLVLIHDGARPLVSINLIESCVEATHRYGAALVALSATDTIKEVREDGFLSHTHDRKKIYHAQTPQGFRYEILKEAVEWAEKKQFTGTDEASLVEALGKPVKIVDGEATNLKITSALDFTIAEAIFQSIVHQTSR